MPVVEPHIERMLHQIRRILSHDTGVAVIALAEQDPAHVRPPGSIARRMRIARLVRFLMVNSMGSDPENGSAFQSHGPATREEVYQKSGALLRRVGMQAMIAHADSQANGHPVEENRDGQGAPCEHE